MNFQKKIFDSLSVFYNNVHIFSEDICQIRPFFMFLPSFSLKLGKNLKNGLIWQMSSLKIRTLLYKQTIKNLFWQLSIFLHFRGIWKKVRRSGSKNVTNVRNVCDVFAATTPDFLPNATKM